MDHIAILRTMCGCEKLMKVPSWTPFIYCALYEPMTMIEELSKPMEIASTCRMRRRVFERYRALGPQTMEYREVRTEE